MSDHDHLGYLVDSEGWKVVDSHGHVWKPEDYQLELESESRYKPAELDVPTIDVKPESVRDTEIRPEIEG